MKISKIKEMSSPELEKELSELKTELFKLRFSLVTQIGRASCRERV